MAAADALVIAQPVPPPGPLQPRPYQLAIAEAAAGRNTLVVLPTGLGKTLIAALVARKHVDKGERVLVLAPTRPLVDQHAAAFSELLPGVEVVSCTGTASPPKRQALWASAPVVVATPQTARNDLLTGRLAGGIGLLVVDEAHRATGNHAAADVAARLADGGSRVLALTASPGGEAGRIRELLQTLRIEHVEARSLHDPDVEPFVAGARVEWVRVVLPPALRAAADRLRAACDRRARFLAGLGLYPERTATRRGFLRAREALEKRLQAGQLHEGLRRAVAAEAQGLRLLHALQLLESQSVRVFLDYAHRMAREDEEIARDADVAGAVTAARCFQGEHPKLRRLVVELRRHLVAHPGSKALVFAQFRDTVHLLACALGAVEGIRARPFVGQERGTGDGMAQKEQRAALEALRAGEVDVLVATSVGEEGLDVPAVDLVVFYEPAPSEIRAIQRRGRTGRHRPGRVVVLMTKDSSDQAAYWSAVNKEREMRHLIEGLKRPDALPAAPSSATPSLPVAGPEVVVDHRELNGPVARLLPGRGVGIRPGTLAVADFAVSDRMVVERKAATDFVTSILDGRLFDQARALKAVAPAPLLLVEGNPWTARPGVKPAAIAGAIAALVADFGLTVLATDSPAETADVIASLARREAESGRGPAPVRYDRPGKSLEEQQRYAVEGLPMVSGTLADRLLAHFGSVRGVYRASPEALAEVNGVGSARAAGIARLMDSPYAAAVGLGPTGDPPRG